MPDTNETKFLDRDIKSKRLSPIFQALLHGAIADMPTTLIEMLQEPLMNGEDR